MCSGAGRATAIATAVATAKAMATAAPALAAPRLPRPLHCSAPRSRSTPSLPRPAATPPLRGPHPGLSGGLVFPWSVGHFPRDAGTGKLLTGRSADPRLDLADTWAPGEGPCVKTAFLNVGLWRKSTYCADGPVPRSVAAGAV